MYLVEHVAPHCDLSEAWLKKHVRVFERSERGNASLVHHHRLVQNTINDNREIGIVPTLCDRMLRERKVVKKQLKTAKGDGSSASLISNLDATQNALKVVRLHHSIHLPHFHYSPKPPSCRRWPIQRKLRRLSPHPLPALAISIAFHEAQRVHCTHTLPHASIWGHVCAVVDPVRALGEHIYSDGPSARSLKELGALLVVSGSEAGATLRVH